MLLKNFPDPRRGAFSFGLLPALYSSVFVNLVTFAVVMIGHRVRTGTFVVEYYGPGFIPLEIVFWYMFWLGFLGMLPLSFIILPIARSFGASGHVAMTLRFAICGGLLALAESLLISYLTKTSSLYGLWPIILAEDVICSLIYAHMVRQQSNLERNDAMKAEISQ